MSKDGQVAILIGEIVVVERGLLRVVGEAHHTTLVNVLRKDGDNTILNSEGVAHRVVVVILAGLMDSVDMVGASAHDSVAILHLHTNHTSLGIDGQVLLDGTVADLHIVGVLQGRCPGVEVD